MNRLFLTISRFAIAAWVGAAMLFVVTGVNDQRTKRLDGWVRTEDSSSLKRVLPQIRFPAYYSFGFTLVGVALASSLAGGSKLMGTRRRWSYCALLSIVLLIMVVDYFSVYLPLMEMLADQDAARPASFGPYHKASKYINATHVGLCLLAAWLIAWPCLKTRDERK